MKIDKKLIKELKDYLDEFGLSEIEYQDGSKKIKVAKNSIANTDVTAHKPSLKNIKDMMVFFAIRQLKKIPTLI